MIITVNSQLLAAELRLLNKIVPTKPAVAILSHALLRAEDGALNLYATDLEVGLTTRCLGTVEESGQATLPVARLLQMVEQFPDADVGISTRGMQATIRCGAFASKLQTAPVEDFPTPAEASGTAHDLDGPSLINLIGKVRHAISATGSKYVLRGALLTGAGTTLAMVATDGKRLALATAGKAEGVDLQAIVPDKTLDALTGMNPDVVKLTVGERHLFFELGADRFLTSRKLEGTFPNYAKIVPRDNVHEVTFDKHAMSAALRRVVLIAEDSGAVYFSLEPGSVTLSAASAGIGSAQEQVALAYDGPPMRPCFDGRYVLAFLGAASGQVVKLALKDANSAGLFTDGDDHVGVISAMRSSK